MTTKKTKKAKKKKKKTMLPTSGEVNLADFRKHLTPGSAADTYYHEDTEVDAPDPPDYGEPPNSTRVRAEDLWLLLSLAVEGALEDPEECFEGREEEVLESHVRRLRTYLKTGTFVSLLRRDPQSAAYLYWEAVVDQPYIIDEHGGVDFGVEEEDWDDMDE